MNLLMACPGFRISTVFKFCHYFKLRLHNLLQLSHHFEAISLFHQFFIKLMLFDFKLKQNLIYQNKENWHYLKIEAVFPNNNLKL